jgi:hypothetical protein
LKGGATGFLPKGTGDVGKSSIEDPIYPNVLVEIVEKIGDKQGDENGQENHGFRLLVHLDHVHPSICSTQKKPVPLIEAGR